MSVGCYARPFLVLIMQATCHRVGSALATTTTTTTTTSTTHPGPFGACPHPISMCPGNSLAPTSSLEALLKQQGTHPGPLGAQLLQVLAQQRAHADDAVRHALDLLQGGCGIKV